MHREKAGGAQQRKFLDEDPRRSPVVSMASTPAFRPFNLFYAGCDRFCLVSACWQTNRPADPVGCLLYSTLRLIIRRVREGLCDALTDSANSIWWSVLLAPEFIGPVTLSGVELYTPECDDDASFHLSLALGEPRVSECSFCLL